MRQINENKDLREIPANQRRVTHEFLEYYSQNTPNHNTAITRSHDSSEYSVKEIGEYFGISYSIEKRIHDSRTFE